MAILDELTKTETCDFRRDLHPFGLSLVTHFPHNVITTDLKMAIIQFNSILVYNNNNNNVSHVA